ncbi:MAG: hypothetical protein IJ363_14875 [Clostridia bacterium]|nr:hypothetical protein [Clostridia bacterium]
MPHTDPAFFTDPFSAASADTPDYTPLIRRIKRRRGLVTAFLILVTLIPLLFIGPIEITLPDRELTAKGLTVGGAIAIIAAGWILGMILSVAVLLPVGNALVRDGDPAKYLALQEGLYMFTTTETQKASVRSVSHLLMGNYPEAVRNADLLTHTQKPAPSAAGLFCKGRAAFFTGDAETLTAVTVAFGKITAGLKGASYPKQKAMLELMDAVTRKDAEAAARLVPSVTAWELTPIVEAQVDLCRARAALLFMENSEGEARKAHRHEAIHRLLSCKEKGGKSVLVPLAEESLANLPAEAEEREATGS